MTDMSRVVLASSNAGKLAEFNQLLDGLGTTFVSQASLGVPDADETGLSFVENALIKARHACAATGLPALADDSGICVDALDGAPGLYAARYAGSHGDDAANRARLLRELDGIAEHKRTAYFIAVIVLLRHAADPAPLIVEGRWTGRILTTARGNGGFGYDPLFLPDGFTLSAGELDPAQKNQLSHRGQAVAALRERLAAR